MTSSDPNYVTPYIKSALRRKNKLMRAGRMEEAGALAERIGDRIIPGLAGPAPKRPYIVYSETLVIQQ